PSSDNRGVPREEMRSPRYLDLDRMVDAEPWFESSPSVHGPGCGLSLPRLRFLRGFLRERRSVRGPAPDPRAEGCIRPIPRGRDEEPPGRGATAGPQLKRLRTGFPAQGVRLRRLHTDDQVLTVDPDRHVPSDEEGDPADHLLFHNPGSTGQPLT